MKFARMKSPQGVRKELISLAPIQLSQTNFVSLLCDSISTISFTMHHWRLLSNSFADLALIRLATIVAGGDDFRL